jgi:hypothetical protein
MLFTLPIPSCGAYPVIFHRYYSSYYWSGGNLVQDIVTLRARPQVQCSLAELGYKPILSNQITFCRTSTNGLCQTNVTAANHNYKLFVSYLGREPCVSTLNDGAQQRRLGELCI